MSLYQNYTQRVMLSKIFTHIYLFTLYFKKRVWRWLPLLICGVFILDFICQTICLEELSSVFLPGKKRPGKTREWNQCVFPNKTNGIKDVFSFSVVLSAGDLSLLQMTPHWSLGLCDTKASRWALVSSFLLLCALTAVHAKPTRMLLSTLPS